MDDDASTPPPPAIYVTPTHEEEDNVEEKDDNVENDVETILEEVALAEEVRSKLRKRCKPRALFSSFIIMSSGA